MFFLFDMLIVVFSCMTCTLVLQHNRVLFSYTLFLLAILSIVVFHIQYIYVAMLEEP